jgi:RimJ/RimL family protein N-acetyltransferase
MVKLRPIKKTDGSFILGVRNDPTTIKFLHDQRSFTINQFEEWFENNKPQWFIIINTMNEKVGYIRTKWVSFPNHLEIGADISLNHRNKGYATAAYVAAFEYFKDVKKMSLEVLENNEIAIKMYKKLGFVEKSTSVINGKNSIYMEKTIE